MSRTQSFCGAILLLMVTFEVRLISGRAANRFREMHSRGASVKREDMKVPRELADIPAFISNENEQNGGGSHESEMSVGGEKWLELEGVPPAKMPVKLHKDVILQCQAVGSPPPRIYWLKNGKPVENLYPFAADELANRIGSEKSESEPRADFVMAKVISKLPIRCIRPEDEGQYTCVADNNGRQVSASTVVAIEEDDPSGEMTPECELRFAGLLFNKKGRRGSPAYVSTAETLHMESIGADIVLPCQGAGRPVPKISWIDAEGQRIVSGKKFQVHANGDLAIRNLSWNEMGEYSCVVENPFGNDSVSTFLYPLMTEDS